MQIEFLCCGEYIKATVAYTHAVLMAILPHVSDFSERLNLPMPIPVTTNHVEDFSPLNRRNMVGGYLMLTNGARFWFDRGHVTDFESPRAFFSLQDPDLIPRFYATQNLTEKEAIALARSTIQKLGHSLEDTLADLSPTIELAKGIGTNVVPHYKITWMDPRGGIATEVEINGNRKTVEQIHFFFRKRLERPAPSVTEQPATLQPGDLFYGMNHIAQINPEYAVRLVPFVLSNMNDWNDRLALGLPGPLTTNHVRRLYLSDNGGWPHAEITLTNYWEFKFRNRSVTYFGSATRFFDSDRLPFRVRDHVGKWKLNEEEAATLVRQAVAKLGYPANFVHLDSSPKITRPQLAQPGLVIPRLLLEWEYPSPENKTQWVMAEINCDNGKIEALGFDDVSFWGQGPPIDVPISKPAASEAK